MQPEDPCIAQQLGRRRIFWTTRPEVCGTYEVCGVDCSIPGLEYENRENGERTIKTEEWLNSLVLNILNTRARTDLKCPSPVAVFGHWSESYRDDDLYVGSTLWNVAAKKYTRINDAVKAIGSAVKADLSKLVALGVATEVDVETSYRGGMQVAVLITVTSVQTRYVLNLSGTY